MCIYVSYSPKGRKVRRRRKNINVRNLAILIAGAVIAIVLFILLITGAVRLITKGIGALTGDGKESSSASVPSDTESNSGSEESQEPVLTFSNVQMTQVDEGQGDLILINSEYGYQSEVEDLQIFYGNKNNSYGLRVAEMYAKPAVVTAMNEMMAGFQTQTGIGSVLLSSAYRNVEEQQQLYDNDLAKNEASTSQTVAQAGYSEHHSGYAVDLSYQSKAGTSYLDGTGDYAWINENCYKYGFIVRYPDGKTADTGIAYEPWHFRYVGKVHAEAITKGSYCMEEYIEMLRLHDQENPYLFVSESGVPYQIYYVPSNGTTTDVPVPNGKEYAVSGTNEGGFVVTVTMDTVASGTPATDSSASSDTSDSSDNSDVSNISGASASN